LSESGKNTTKGVLGILQRVREYLTYEVDDVKLEDGKPLAFKYVPFTMADWDSVEMGPYAGLPMFNESPDNDDESADDWTLKEKLLLHQYYRMVCRHGIRQIRDIEDGKEVWRDITIIPDAEDDSQAEDGSVKLSMATLAALGVAVPLGAACVNHANYGGELSQYVERGFLG
jgi:hypothetical protein